MNELQNDDNQNEQEIQLTDLEAPDAEEVVGGSCGFRQSNLPPYPGGTGFVNNHNETVVDDVDAPALFADLEPIGEVIGGTWTGNITLGGGTTIGQSTPNGVSKDLWTTGVGSVDIHY